MVHDRRCGVIVMLSQLQEDGEVSFDDVYMRTARHVSKHYVASKPRITVVAAHICLQ